MISSDRLGGMDQRVGHISAVCNRFLEEVEGREMCILVLCVGLEHDNWILSSEIRLPCVCVLHGDKVDFVKDEDDLLIRKGEDLALDVLASAC